MNNPAIRDPLIAGADYNSKKIDIALVQGNRVVSAKVYQLGQDLAARVAMVSRLVLDLAAAGVEAVYLEQRWARVEKNIQSAMLLRDVSTGLLWLGTAAELRLELTPINTWHKEVLGNGGIKSEDAKRASKDFVRLVYKMQPESDDQADAICLATFGSRRERLVVRR